MEARAPKNIAIVAACQKLVRLKRELAPRVLGVSVAATFTLAAIKLVIAIAAWSPFLTVNALFTAGMGFARQRCLATERASTDQGRLKSRRAVGLIVLASSVLYIAYAIRLFWQPESASYTLTVALAIATVTFTELSLAITAAVRDRHSFHTPAFTRTLVNLAAFMTALVLTQTALLSVVAEPARSTGHLSWANAIAGVVCGTLSAGTGIVIALTGNKRATQDR
jgi:hypothetical protein